MRLPWTWRTSEDGTPSWCERVGSRSGAAGELHARSDDHWCEFYHGSGAGLLVDVDRWPDLEDCHVLWLDGVGRHGDERWMPSPKSRSLLSPRSESPWVDGGVVADQMRKFGRGSDLGFRGRTAMAYLSHLPKLLDLHFGSLAARLLLDEAFAA
ncbi:hypothetical protein ACLOJK_034520 [Asimina triloba]